MKAAFIVNPLAGRGKAQKIWKEMEPRLKMDCPYHVYYTERAGDAVRLARLAQEEGASVLVSVGGDGTAHEIVNGMDLHAGTLGLIPAGTGNDFCRCLNYPHDPFEIADSLFSWKSRRVDLGKIGDRYFINVIGAGFDAQVAHDVNRQFKCLTGIAAYLAGILKNLVTYHNAPLELKYDGHSWSGKSLLIAVGNGRYYAGGITILPSAEPDDGWFHICLVKDLSRCEILNVLPRAISGRHTSHRDVAVLKARRIKVHSPLPLLVQADGEIIGALPLAIEMKPQALSVLAPGRMEQHGA